MGDDVVVRSSALTQAGARAESVGESIALNLARVVAVVEQSHPSFNSPAGDAFRREAGEVGTHLRALLTALNSMAAAVGAAPRAYDATDEGSAAEIGQIIQQDLPGEAGSILSALRGGGS